MPTDRRLTSLTISLILLILSISSSGTAQISVSDFTDDFECGNVTNVARIGTDSLTFQIRLDNQPGDTYGWFCFAITGNAGRTATLFLTNPDNWQNSRHAPLYSTDFQNWERVGQVWQQGGSVAFRQELTADTVWFAQDFPYTVTSLYAFLDTIAGLPFAFIDTLGYSVHGRPIKMVTICDPEAPDQYKKDVWLISRQHPMESPATYLLRGLLDAVTADDRFGTAFRKNIRLFIVPISNPDGVVEGISRQNANGFNLNREWQTNIAAEQPEVRAIHSAIDSAINDGSPPDLFIDFHAAMHFYDFGFRMAYPYVTAPYYNNQSSYLHHLESYDLWQDASRWEGLDTSYAYGVSCVTMYDMYQIDAISPEQPWTGRDDSTFTTIENLIAQGPATASAIYDYICPVSIVGLSDTVVTTLLVIDEFNIRLFDYDQRSHNTLQIIVRNDMTGDLEQVTVHRVSDEGLFETLDPVPTNDSPPTTNDGFLSTVEGSIVLAHYADPDLVSRTFVATAYVSGRCGDLDADGAINISDIMFLVEYLFYAGVAPDNPDRADVNSSGSIDISDLTYLVSYLFASGPPPDCH